MTGTRWRKGTVRFHKNSWQPLTAGPTQLRRAPAEIFLAYSAPARPSVRTKMYFSVSPHQGVVGVPVPSGRFLPKPMFYLPSGNSRKGTSQTIKRGTRPGPAQGQNRSSTNESERSTKHAAQFCSKSTASYLPTSSRRPCQVSQIGVKAAS